MPQTLYFPTTPLARLTGHNGPVHAVSFSSGSGQYILTGSADRAVRLYNATNTTHGDVSPIKAFCAHGHEVLDIAVSTDNSRFASVGGDKQVFVWDVATATVIRRFAGHAARVNCVAFGGLDDQVVVSGSFDGTVKTWDLRSRSERPIASFDEARDGVSSVAVRGGEIFAGCVDGRVRVYDLATGRVDVDVLGPSVTSVCPAAVDGDSYLVSTLDSRVRLMDRKTGACLQTFKHKGFVNDTFRLRSRLAMADACVISGGEDGSVFIWDVLSGALLERVWHVRDDGLDNVGSLGDKKNVVSAVAWNQARKMWASAGGDGAVCIFGGPKD